MFIFIFKFSRINSVRNVSFAYIPPTLAAAIIIKSGFSFEIFSFVLERSIKFVSFLVEHINSSTFVDLDNTLSKDFPTSPELPKIKNFHLFSTIVL